MTLSKTFCFLFISISIKSFFFQAEDGIRDLTVTGVQTCALPIFLVLADADAGVLQQFARRGGRAVAAQVVGAGAQPAVIGGQFARQDRKSTRLNSSHSQISYAVFCLKKKKKKNNELEQNIIIKQI